MKPITHFFIAGLLLIASSLAAQPLVTTFSPSTVNVAVNGNVDLQLKVQNFTTITSLQFSISYNNVALQYLSADGFTLPGFVGSNINAPSAGKLTVSWFPDFATFPNGVNVNDGTSILTLHFKAIANGSGNVNLTTTPLAIEVTRDFSPIMVTYQNGGSNVTVGSGGPPPLTGFKILANTIYIPKDSTRCMPVTVNDFDNITSFQYAMHWDKNVLQYVNTQGSTLPTLLNFTPNQNTGTLLAAWFDNENNPPGVTKADGAKIYDVCFKGIGPVGTNSLVTFDGVGFPPGAGGAEAYNANSQNVWTSMSGVTDTVFIVSAPAPPINVTFVADKDTVIVGGQTCVNINATNFDDLVNAQFAVTYNAAQLQYQSIQLGANPLNLGVSNLTPSSGQINFTWSGTPGVTLPNNTTIFSVCFVAAAPAGTTVPVNIGSAPGFNVSIVREPSTNLTPTLTAGHVYVQAAPQATLQFSNIAQPSCNGGSNGTLSVTVQNGSPNNYTWSGPPGFVSVNQANLTGLKAGTYNVTVTLQGGSTITGTQTISQPTAIALPTANPTPITCNGGNNGAINISANGGTGALSYTWTGPGTFSSTAEDLSGLSAGNYTVVVRDANNCTLTSSPITVTQPNPISVTSTAPVVTDVSCFGGSNGSINISTSGGTAPYTYAWTGPTGPAGNNEDLPAVGAGSYTVSVTDFNNCPVFVSQAIQVQGPTAPLAAATTNVQNVRCFGELNGAITLNVTGGWAPYTSYTWKDQNGTTVSSAPSPTTLAAGTYNVTVTDNKGCTTSLAQAVTVMAPASAMTTSAQSTPAECAGSPTGTISLTVAGGYGNYQTTWSPTVNNPNTVPSGTYNVTVTDAGGCSDTETVTVGGPAQPLAAGNPIITNVSCASAGDGCISLTISGGTPNYSVSWSNQQSGQSICGLAGGTYTPTITDAEGCSLTLAPIQVTEPTALAINPTVVEATGTSANGSIDLHFNGGGVGPHSFSWTGPNNYVNLTTTGVISGLVSGDYFVTITDNTGCQLVQTINVPNDNPLGNTTVTGITPSCGDNGCITLAIPAGATSPFVISWSGGTETFNSYTPTMCGFPSGPYNITLTDAVNNNHVFPVNFLPLLPALVSSALSNPNENFSNGSITLTSAVPGVTMNYLWNTGSTSNSLINIDSGLYVVTVTNPNSGCTTVIEFHLVRVYQPHNGDILGTNMPSCQYSSNGSINFSMSGGAQPYTFNWAGSGGFSASTQNISGLPSGNYSLTVTDAIGVTSTYGPVPLSAQSNLVVTNVSELSTYPGGFQVSGPSDCDGEAEVSFNGGVGNATISWSNGASGISTNTLCGGEYTVTVTDALGCTSTWTDELTAPAPILASALPLTNYNTYNVKCHGSCDGAARITITGGGVGPYIFQWPASVPFNLITTGADFSQASGLCGGDYNVTITDANGNTSLSTVTLNEPDELSVQFIAQLPTEGACDGQITAVPVGGNGTDISYEWTGNRDHQGTTALAEGLCAGEVVFFQLIDEFGCEASAQDTVEYPPTFCFAISEAITPNDDGDNDFLKILCIEDSPSNDIEIYNRWGQLVFKVKGYVNNDPSRAWYGLSNGEPLPEGVYFYVLNYVNPIDNEAVQKKGYVNLLR